MNQKTKGAHRAIPYPEVLRRFRRQVFANRNGVVSGVSVARSELEERHIPQLITDIANEVVNLGTYMAEPFPIRLNQLLQTRKFHPLDFRREALWSASTLAVYRDQLNAFIKLRRAFESHYFAAEWDKCHELLNEVQSEFGYSLWLIGYRLQLFQMSGGLKAQKDYLVSILTADGLGGQVGWIAYVLSMRSEENSTSATMHIETEDLASGTMFSDLALHTIFPSNPTEISSPESLIAAANSSPAIDKLHALTTALKLSIVRDGVESDSILPRVLGLLNGVDDDGLARLSYILGITKGPPQADVENLQNVDDYTAGRYEKVPLLDNTLLPHARARLFSGDYEPEKDDLGNRASWALGQDLIGTTNGLQAIDELERLSLTYGSHPLAIQLAVAVSRRDSTDYQQEAGNEIEKLAALSGCVINPWAATKIAEIVGLSDFWNRVQADYPDSISVLLQTYSRSDESIAYERIHSLDLPPHRKAVYAGHHLMVAQKYAEASESYRMAVDSEVLYVRLQAKASLFNSLRLQGKFGECLELFVDQCMVTPASHYLFEISEVLEQAAGVEDFSSTINFAIATHIAAGELDPGMFIGLSDIYENIVNYHLVSDPTGLVRNIESVGRARLVYFLRYICTLRVFEDSTKYTSLNEVEQARIRVCQKLVELDLDNRDVYSNEIRIITRDARASQLLKKVQSNYIFVDEDGLRTSVGPHLRVLYDRFVALRRAPHENYSSEKISRQLGRLLDKSDELDIKSLKLPTSEPEALFANILNIFVVQFATNSAYGLDPHLSTSIRHGTFEGPLISALTSNDLLSIGLQLDGSSLPPRWKREFAELSQSELDLVGRHVRRFTTKINSYIDEWGDELLHIRHPESAPKGLFNFYITVEERLEMLHSLTLDTSFEDLWTKLSAFCWKKVETAMVTIREKLSGTLSTSFDAAFDSLGNVLGDNLPSDVQGPMLNSIARAQTATHSAIREISGWFNRSEDSLREDFEVEWAVDVARRQIENCYVIPRVTYILQFRSSRKVAGEKFDSLVEIIFILLQNAVRHSQMETDGLKISLDVLDKDDGLVLQVTSGLHDSVRLDDLRPIAIDAASRYNRDAAMERTRTEGGSGLSKVWRMCEFDLKVSHSLELTVLDTQEFVAILKVGNLWGQDENRSD